MTVTELLALHQPHSDIETHRPVFACPFCGARVLGPKPEEERPTWIIPLLCCAAQEHDPWWLDKPPMLDPRGNMPLTHVLDLRRHVVWHRRTGQRFVLWLPAPS